MGKEIIGAIKLKYVAWTLPLEVVSEEDRRLFLEAENKKNSLDQDEGPVWATKEEDDVKEVKVEEKDDGLGETVLKQINSTPVVVYTKSKCNDCKNVLDLFKDVKKGKLKVIELDKVENGEALHRHVKRIAAKPNVPQVFFGGMLLGDDKDIRNLVDQKRLSSYLQAVGAL